LTEGLYPQRLSTAAAEAVEGLEALSLPCPRSSFLLHHNLSYTSHVFQ
jgi:hypothetical protein